MEGNPFATKTTSSLRDEAVARASRQRSAKSAASNTLSKSMYAPPASEAKAAPMTSSWHAGNANSTQRYAQVPGNSYFGDTPPRTKAAPSNSTPASTSSTATPGAASSSLATPPPAPNMVRGSGGTPGSIPSHQESTTEAIANAREQWSMQGSTEGGQILEDRRRMMTQQAAQGAGNQAGMQSGMQSRMNANGLMSQTLTSTVQLEKILSSSMSLNPTYSTKITAAEQRIDPAGSGYTAYIISVIGPSGNNLVEHRFSEFHKLHLELEANKISIKSPFPPKSLNGRIGNWTPSALLSPQSQQQLISQRVIKLDQWLLAVVEELHLGKIQSKVIRNELIEFLEISAAGRPPCDRANYIEGWNSLDENDSNPSTIVPGEEQAKEQHGGGAQRVLSNPLSFTLGSEIRKACYTLSNMCDPKGMLNNDRSVPLDLIRGAKGIAFLSVIKGGVIISARVGTGMVVARTQDGGWSAPSAIGTVGLGWGAQIGGDITTYMIILNTPAAVKSFSGSNQISLGTELDVAVGPVGRSVEGKVGAGGGEFLAPAYSYAHSKGLFAGISLEGAIISTRHDVNSKFYGKPVDTGAVLGGGIPRPRAAECLYKALEEAERVDIVGWRPSVALKESGLVKSDVPVPVSQVVGTTAGGWPASSNGGNLGGGGGGGGGGTGATNPYGA